MNDYVIYTDSACDIKESRLSEWGVKMSALTVKLSDSTREYRDGELESKSFYQMMRDGKSAKTAAVNSEIFKSEFEKILDTGRDILYLGFSSGLSATYNSARIAGEELKEKYPNRQVIAIDTRSASAGLGLIVYLTSLEQKKGASIEEAANYAEGLKDKLCHWFTVDDLVYLKRGGRISPTTVFFGNMLGIKPVLYMDDEGHLKSHSKAMGRRAAIEALVKKYGELAEEKTCGTVFISHGDCLADAKTLEKLLAERYGAKVKLITDVGCVIGSHSGPGTLALFFLGKSRIGD